jgi:Rrf2 family protein
MIELAKNYEKNKITLNEIAEKQDLSIKYLASLLGKLHENNLINSYKGKYGGYEIARNPEVITVADILEAVEGPMALIACIYQPEICKKVENCHARDIWEKLSLDIKNVFKNYTLKELI